MIILNKHIDDLVKIFFEIVRELIEICKDFETLKLDSSICQCDFINDIRSKYLDLIDILNDELYELTSKFTDNLNEKMCMLNNRINKTHIEEFKEITLNLLKIFRKDLNLLNINFIKDAKKIFLKL